MVSVDATVVVAAFPALRAHFAETSAANLSWTINAYTIVFASLLVPAGRAVDRFGHRRCFFIAMAGFTLASAACAFAISSGTLILARVLKAVAAALLAPASLALILAAFPEIYRARSAGLWSAAGALGASLGPVMGSLLIDWFSWRLIFLINVPVGLGVLWMGRGNHSEQRTVSSHHRFDVVGTSLLISGIGFLVGGLAQAGQGARSGWEVLQSPGIGLALIAGYVVFARGKPNAPLGLFANSNYRWASAATLVLGMAFGLMFLAFYLFFTGVWKYPQSLAGVAGLPGPLAATMVSVLVNKKQAEWGQKRLLTIGGILYAISNLWLVMRISPTPDYFGTWLPGQILGGMAIGLILPSIAGAAAECLKADNLGEGSAVNNAIRQIGSALGVALAISLAGSTTAAIESFQQVYLCLMTAGLLIAVLALPLVSLRKPFGVRA